MGMGAMAWACLLLSVHQGPADEVPINARRFQIPIKLDARRQSDIRRLCLYVSDDEGQTWQVQQYAQPVQKAFEFTAKHDGKYWFIVGAEDNQGQTTPRDPNRARPNLRLLVDTVAPRIQLTASRLPNGEVLARWTIQEENPDPRSLRLEYHTDAMRADQQPTPLPVEPSAGPGEKHFNPGNANEVRVFVRMKDRADNQGKAEAVVTVPGAAPAAPAAPAAVGAETAAFGTIPTMRPDQAGTPGTLASRQTPRAPGDPAPLGNGPAPMALTPPEDPHGGNHASGAPLAASSERTPAAAFAPETARGSLPAVKIVNKSEVKLEFEVAKVGPSGLGGADVYVTMNEGASWGRVPGELPVTLAPGSDLHGPVRGSVSVKLPGEGVVYGFIVAVKSKAGLGRPAPRPNEPPQVRIELDATAPKASLIKPVPDPAQRDTLLLSWEALDRNLPANPVTLEWAERREGPWAVIGGGPLPNHGSYPWRLPDGIPSRVYLRLTVRDAAGNAAKAETEKPELIDLSVPETNIIGVAPTAR